MRKSWHFALAPSSSTSRKHQCLALPEGTTRHCKTHSHTETRKPLRRPFDCKSLQYLQDFVLLVLQIHHLSSSQHIDSIAFSLVGNTNKLSPLRRISCDTKHTKSTLPLATAFNRPARISPLHPDIILQTQNCSKSDPQQTKLYLWCYKDDSKS